MAVRGKQDSRIADYKAANLDNPQAHDLTIRALRAGAINTARIPKVLKEWDEPRHPEFEPRTVWSYFNAVTEVTKGLDVAEQTRRTQLLHGVTDSYLGLA